MQVEAVGCSEVVCLGSVFLFSKNHRLRPGARNLLLLGKVTRAYIIGGLRNQLATEETEEEKRHDV